MIKDLFKYKRLFTFGCSFTNYIYPTWADVLSKEMPDAEYYNLAFSGAGNSYIAWKIAEANNKFKFNETDLVIVMYTTFCREDRYVNKGWHLYGNVFNNNYYDESFYKYADPDGYAIQNVATIDLSMGYLKSLPCTALFLNGYPFANPETVGDVFDQEVIQRLKETYSNVFDLPLSYMNFLHPNMKETDRFAEKGLAYTCMDGTTFLDAHPLPIWGHEYLKYLKFPLTDLSYKFAMQETEACRYLKDFQKIMERYKTSKQQMDNKFRGMF